MIELHFNRYNIIIGKLEFFFLYDFLEIGYLESKVGLTLSIITIVGIAELRNSVEINYI